MNNLVFLPAGSTDFPDPSAAMNEPNGLLAAGSSLTSNCILAAYRRGIFPWFQHGQPILWWSPNPRMVLRPKNLHISKSLQKLIKQQKLQTSFNKKFREVVEACAGARNIGSETWITEGIKKAYCKLFDEGFGLSVEVWSQNQLVGGLYGVILGEIFFGESMFSKVSDASKIALVTLVSHLETRGIKLIDCQVHSPHLQSMGAEVMPRDFFLSELKKLTTKTADRSLTK
jgi:leucyl/phenylalanyl-tRNA--protein transferase